MYAADGDAAGVGEGRDDHHAVGAFAGDGLNRGGDDVRLQGVMATEGGVAAAHEPQPQTGTGAGICGPGSGQRIADHFIVAGCSFCGVQAPGVGQHVHRWLRLSEGPDEVLDLPAGEHGQIRNGLRSGGVVVEHYEHPGGLRAGRGDGVGNQAGGNPDFGREGGQDVCFKGHSALRCVEIQVLR